MPSWTSIANRALSGLTQKRITSYLSLTERGAISFQQVYQQVTQEVLASHPWNCAMSRVVIDADTATPTWGFGNQYTLPAGCLRVWKLDPEHHGTNPQFKVIGRKVHADEGAAIYAELIMDVTDPEQFSPLLAKAISAHCAEAMALDLTDSSTRRDEMAKWAKDCMDEARFADGQEGSPDEVDASYLEEARY